MSSVVTWPSTSTGRTLRVAPRLGAAVQRDELPRVVEHRRSGGAGLGVGQVGEIAGVVHPDEEVVAHGDPAKRPPGCWTMFTGCPLRILPVAPTIGMEPNTLPGGSPGICPHRDGRVVQLVERGW